MKFQRSASLGAIALATLSLAMGSVAIGAKPRPSDFINLIPNRGKDVVLYDTIESLAIRRMLEPTTGRALIGLYMDHGHFGGAASPIPDLSGMPEQCFAPICRAGLAVEVTGGRIIPAYGEVLARAYPGIEFIVPFGDTGWGWWIGEREKHVNFAVVDVQTGRAFPPGELLAGFRLHRGKLAVRDIDVREVMSVGVTLGGITHLLADLPGIPPKFERLFYNEHIDLSQAHLGLGLHRRLSPTAAVIRPAMGTTHRPSSGVGSVRRANPPSNFWAR